MWQNAETPWWRGGDRDKNKTKASWSRQATMSNEPLCRSQDSKTQIDLKKSKQRFRLENTIASDHPLELPSYRKG